MLGHILEPADDSDGIHLVVGIHKACAGILRGIIGQEAAGNHGVGGFLITNLYRARTFFILADDNLQLVAAIRHDDGTLARLGVQVTLLVIPELAVVDGAVVEESYLPVALVVAPIGRDDLLPALLDRFDALDLESTVAIAFDKVECLRTLRQCREVECHIPLAVLVCQKVLVEFYTVGRRDGVALLTYLQIGIASKLEPEVGMVRPLLRSDIHYGLVVLQLHLRHVEGEIEESVAVAVSILCGGLLPHDFFLFCLSRQRCEGKQNG